MSNFGITSLIFTFFNRFVNDLGKSKACFRPSVDPVLEVYFYLSDWMGTTSIFSVRA